MNDVPKGDRGTARQLVPVADTVPALRDPYGRLALYGASLGDEAEQSGFNVVLEYLRILYKRKWLILSIAAAFVVISAVKTLMEAPLYTATVRLQVDREARVVEMAILRLSIPIRFLQTEYQLLEGRTMAERVVSALKLGNDADFLNPKGFSITGAVMGLLGLIPSPSDKKGDKTAAERWAVGIVLGNRAVRPVTNSRLIEVSYTDPDPGRAQRIANAYGDAFIASTIDKRFQANESAKIFLDDKIKQLKLRLEKSERALVEFAQEEQIVAVDITEKSSIAENNLAAAHAELGTLISERTKNEELWRQFDRTDAANLPQVLSNSVIGGLRNQRNQLELDYQEKLKTFKPAYPAMVQIKTKIEEIDRQLAEIEHQGLAQGVL
jgi:uncharacterized protein involved in exopolysaccharide biosynthesis